jgi:hypothetical protein
LEINIIIVVRVIGRLDRNKVSGFGQTIHHHLMLDVKYTHISLLELDYSASKREIHNNVVEYHRMKEM